MTPPIDAQRRLYLAEVAQHALRLREALVRHDDNLAAWQVLDALPTWLMGPSEQLRQAWHDQRRMVLHLLDPVEYERYYATNPHERPFEQQTGLTVPEAGRIPRFGWLRNQLVIQADGSPLTLVDLGANDGAMLAYLTEDGVPIKACVGVDLNPDCVERARHRGINAITGRAENAPELILNHSRQFKDGANAVILFEVVEHVLDPAATIAAAAACVKPGGMLYVSCPVGAVEQGWLPDWDRVEFKGHVRTVEPAQLRGWLEQAGLEVTAQPMFADGTMICAGRKP